ncbi:ComEA family DNA-binding protein [Hydrogenovibrio sp. JE_KL2]|uniref:ComEA family DNA-binding protein n=1 Tax=Hydrogenovibrio sp. JE_KL2 TaxID=2651188 RepID=UPI00128CC4A3|nr:ComEA family DNA-binding protein [Hydrogenovibrio sp. JE_KL2]
MKTFALVLGVLFSSLAFASPVNINSASAEKIATSLNGIGQKKAEAIVAYRNEHGKFMAVSDLAKVKGIGTKTLANNEADILLEDAK